MKFFLLGMVMFGEAVFGSSASAAGDKTKARRVEVLSQRAYFEPLEGPLRAERAYAVWSAPLEHWIYVLTNASGGLSKPVEALAPGTVLPSFVLGGEDGKRYLLTKKGTWAPSRAPFQRRVWELSKNARYRVFLSAEEPRRSTAEAEAGHPGAGSPKSQFHK